jgi:hypothetical protein
MSGTRANYRSGILYALLTALLYATEGLSSVRRRVSLVPLLSWARASARCCLLSLLCLHGEKAAKASSPFSEPDAFTASSPRESDRRRGHPQSVALLGTFDREVRFRQTDPGLACTVFFMFHRRFRRRNAGRFQPEGRYRVARYLARPRPGNLAPCRATTAAHRAQRDPHRRMVRRLR